MLLSVPQKIILVQVIAQLGKDGETKECGTVQLENGVSRYSFNCNDFEADRVMVLLNKNFLTLCEVEVLVKQASMPESKHDNVALEGMNKHIFRRNFHNNQFNHFHSIAHYSTIFLIVLLEL